MKRRDFIFTVPLLGLGFSSSLKNSSATKRTYFVE